MKRMLALMLAAVFFLLPGCGKMELPDEKLSALGEECVRYLREGNYDAVADSMSVALKLKLKSADVKKAWEDTTQPLGGFLENMETKVMKTDRFATVSVVSAFEKNGLISTISYDGSGKIVGLFMNYYPLPAGPEETETYKETDLVVEALKAYPLRARLTMPKGVENPPLVVYVQGSGASDLDETIGAVANKPFRDIAHGLAEQGIASLRYDKRYFTYPELGTQQDAVVTIQTEVLDDVNALLALAQQQPVNQDRIYLLGHSLGGMLAPEIARQNDSVKGIISLAGSPFQLEDLILDQNIAMISKDQTLDDREKETYIGQIRQMVNQVKELTEEKKPKELILNMPADYWLSLNQIKAGEIAGKLTIPMLFLQGTADFQVSFDKDFGEWKKLLASSSHVEFREYEGLNHIFFEANGKDDATEYDIEGHVSPEVIADIADWVKAQ